MRNQTGFYLNTVAGLAYRYGYGEMVIYSKFFGHTSVDFNRYHELGFRLGSAFNIKLIRHLGIYCDLNMYYFPKTEITLNPLVRPAVPNYKPNKFLILGNLGLKVYL
ncbi:hypothetical protein GYB22_07215 [bacterium]|nr:hypothetical protein [bacterium]